MEPTSAPLPRETGEQKAKPCPTCGTERTLIQNTDGSSSPAPCSTCFGEVDRDAAIAQITAAPATTEATVTSVPTPTEQAAEAPLPREIRTDIPQEA